MARSSDSHILLSIFRDKTFQAREIRRVIVLAMTYLVVTTLLLGIFYHAMLGKLVEGAAPLFFVSEDMQRFNEMVPGMAAVLGRWIIVMLMINVIITAILSVYITRKLGHPLMAIKRALNEVGDGNLDVRLRESDSREFADLSAAMNSAMSETRMRVLSIKHEFEALETLRDQPATTDAEVRAAVQNCQLALSYFHVSDAEDEQPSSAG